MKYIAILGRQPALGLAELEVLCGHENTALFSPTTTTFDSSDPLDVQRLGGSIKLGEIVFESSETHWNELSKKIVRHYTDLWRSVDHKITLGISVYDWRLSPRDVQKTGIVLKQSLKKQGVSLRVVPNNDLALNSAASHHNKLGLSPNKVELIIARHGKRVIVAESTGAQNITALAARDQDRPKRDAFVGMLPPKLAMMMINLSGIASSPSSFSKTASRLTSVENASASDRAADVLENEIASGSFTPAQSGEKATKKTILDPFCGTGVLLQEALLLGFDAYGTDLSDKMIDYSEQNLAWLKDKYHLDGNVRLHQGDAMNTTWQPPIDAVVGETYLGQPFSAPPRPQKLEEVRGNCNHILKQFLANLAPQIAPGTPLCLAVPAWRDDHGRTTHLPLIGQLDTLGYERISLAHTPDHQLIYYREDQIVARQLLLLRRKG